MPVTDLRQWFKKKQMEQWQLEYDISLKGIRFHDIQPKIYRKPWFNDITNRHFIKTLNRARNKHGLYPVHKNKLGLATCHFSKLRLRVVGYIKACDFRLCKLPDAESTVI
uniref:Uncharacterized protein LOC114328181 n=1 Tax=Diabrotica virgifera virgifera TaxID=50390 RepID=A0A6P7FB21_DIAVI